MILRSLIGQIIFAKQIGTQHKITARPGLEPEIDNFPLIQVIDDILEQHMRHLLAIFIRALFPQIEHFIDDVHAHTQFDRRFLALGRPCLPVSDLTLIVLLDFCVLLAGHVSIKENRSGGLDAPPTFSDGRLLLFFQPLAVTPVAVFRLYCQLHQHTERFFTERKLFNQRAKLAFNDVNGQRPCFCAAIDAFGMAITQLAPFVMATQPGTQFRVMQALRLALTIGAIK